MTQTLTFRATAADLDALEAVRRPGESTTDALRRALQAAVLLQERANMRAEAESLAADADDLAEAREVQAVMGELRAR